MATLAPSDLRAIVAFLANAATIRAPVPFTRELLGQLAAVVGCAYATYNESDFAGPDVAEDGIATTSDTVPHERRVRFEGVPDLWQDLGIIDQMCVTIGPSGPRFVLERCDRDFDQRDRTIMRELRPHLLEMWRRAATNRRLEAALEALDDDEAEGVMFLGAGLDIEFASASANRLLERYLGGATPLPVAVTGWLEEAHDAPLVLTKGDSQLVINAADGGRTLVLHERSAGRNLLTRREMEVMRCVAAGLTNEEIAHRLWIEVPTVRKHLEHVFDKLHVRNRTAAVAALRLVSGASTGAS